MIVGIYSDFPQSGKSTAKKVFEANGFESLSFATTVKESLEVVLIALGISPKDTFEYLYGSKKGEIIPHLNCTSGYLMSAYATTFMREQISEDVWLNTLQQSVAKRKQYCQTDFVIDDLRFKNEFDYISENGITIKVVRDDVEKNHGRVAKSEGLLANFPFDYVIENNGTLEEYNEKVQKLIERVRNV